MSYAQLPVDAGFAANPLNAYNGQSVQILASIAKADILVTGDDIGKTMPELSHFDESGASRMVDVGAKAVSRRMARASGVVRMSAETLTLVRDKRAVKGDVLEVARLAGIIAAKRTPELIPLCHTLPLEAVAIDFEFADGESLRIVATVQVEAKTGVEMEALTAVSVAALTVYDMCKSVDRGMTIGPIQLEEKSGGRSGHWRRDASS